jgi:hypothetical protein
VAVVAVVASGGGVGGGKGEKKKRAWESAGTMIFFLVVERAERDNRALQKRREKGRVHSALLCRARGSGSDASPLGHWLGFCPV